MMSREKIKKIVEEIFYSPASNGKAEESIEKGCLEVESLVLNLLEEQKIKYLNEITKEEKCWINYNAKEALKNLSERIDKIKFRIGKIEKIISIGTDATEKIFKERVKFDKTGLQYIDFGPGFIHFREGDRLFELRLHEPKQRKRVKKPIKLK